MNRNSFSMFASVLLIVAIASATTLAVSCNAVSVVSDNSIVFFISFCILVLFCFYSRPLAMAAAKIAFFARLCQTNCKTFLKLAEFPDFLADKIVFRDLGRLC